MFLKQIFTPILKNSFNKSSNLLTISTKSIFNNLNAYGIRLNSIQKKPAEQIKFSQFYRGFFKKGDPSPVKVAFNQTLTANGDFKASPLLLNHGIFGSKDSWKSVNEILELKLKPKRNIVTIDARNHGESPHTKEHTYEAMAQDLKNLIDLQKFGDKVSLLGHNMGGITAALFSLKWPNNVDKLIVADTLPYSVSPNLLYDQELLHFMKLMKFDKTTTLEQAREKVDTLLSSVLPDKKERHFLLSNLVQTKTNGLKWKLNVQALIKNFDKITNFPTFESGNKFTGSTLFIMSETIKNEPSSEFYQLQEFFPKAKFKTVKNSGHFIDIENATEFLEIVIEFLNEN